MRLGLEIKIGGGLWSAIALYRFGSQFEYCSNDGRKAQLAFVFEICKSES
jgi:hypothetical protein